MPCQRSINYIIFLKIMIESSSILSASLSSKFIFIQFYLYDIKFHHFDQSWIFEGDLCRKCWSRWHWNFPRFFPIGDAICCNRQPIACFCAASTMLIFAAMMIGGKNKSNDSWIYFWRTISNKDKWRCQLIACFCVSSTLLIFFMMFFRGNDYFVHSQMKLVDRPTERFNIWIFISWVGGGDRSGAAELSLSGSCTS